MRGWSGVTEAKREYGEMKPLLLAAAVAVTTATTAAALQPLHENPRVINSFYALGMADIIRRGCDEIEPRWFRAYNYLRSLEKYARKAGYTQAQIDELTDNDAAKDRLEARIRADLAKRGASSKTPEGYCTVGREEIAKGSAAGRLLRAN